MALFCLGQIAADNSSLEAGLKVGAKRYTLNMWVRSLLTIINVAYIFRCLVYKYLILYKVFLPGLGVASLKRPSGSLSGSRKLEILYSPRDPSI